MIPRKRFSDRIIYNTIFNALGRGWQFLLALFLTPYIISRLGVDQYGIWALFSVLTGYLGLFDMGIGESYVRYIADAAARRDEEELNRIVNTGLLFNVLVSLGSVAVVLWIREPLLRFMGVTSEHFDAASGALAVALAGWATSDALSALTSLPVGLQRMGVQNAIQAGSSLMFAGLAVLFLERGTGLVGLIWASTLSDWIVSIIYVYVAFRLCPSLRLGLQWVRGSVLKTLFWFGYQLKLTVFADLVSFQTDKILIGHFLGTPQVTDYQLGSSLASTLRSYPTLVVSAVTPAVSELNARNETGPILEVYRRAYKYLVLIAFPLASLLFFCSRDLMGAWMGDAFPRATLALRFLAVGYLFNVMGAAAASIGAAIERPDIQKKAAILMACMNLSLSLLFILRFGFPGVLFATMISLIAAHIYHMILLHTNLSIPLLPFWKDALSRPLVACLLSGAAVYALWQLPLGFEQPVGRSSFLALVAAKGTLFTTLYGALLYSSKYLDQSDFELLGRILPPRFLFWMTRMTSRGKAS